MEAEKRAVGALRLLSRLRARREGGHCSARARWAPRPGALPAGAHECPRCPPRAVAQRAEDRAP